MINISGLVSIKDYLHLKRKEKKKSSKLKHPNVYTPKSYSKIVPKKKCSKFKHMAYCWEMAFPTSNPFLVKEISSFTSNRKSWKMDSQYSLVLVDGTYNSPNSHPKRRIN